MEWRSAFQLPTWFSGCHPAHASIIRISPVQQVHCPSCSLHGLLSSPFTCPQGLPRLCPSLPTMAFLLSSPATLTWSLLQPAHPLCPSHLPSALVRELALVHALRRVSLPETLTCQDVSWLVCSGIIPSAEGML